MNRKQCIILSFAGFALATIGFSLNNIGFPHAILISTIGGCIWGCYFLAGYILLKKGESK